MKNNSVKTALGLRKVIHGKIYVLDRTWDLAHGRGWFARVYSLSYLRDGFGFDKHSKFAAIRKALKDFK